jgi:hypothetical protein
MITPSTFLSHPALKHWETGEVRNTKDVAKALGVATPVAYRLLCEAEKLGILSCYGYRVAPGVWESREHSSRQATSLYWQRD